MPGPELRVHQGDLVEATLVNKDISEGVSIHWHGVDLPNAEDGVSGVTQDTVRPGGSYVYRFRAPYAGTYWYHSHQHSAEQVERGLYGALVVLPRRSRRRRPTSSRSRTRSTVCSCSTPATARNAGASPRVRPSVSA